MLYRWLCAVASSVALWWFLFIRTIQANQDITWRVVLAIGLFALYAQLAGLIAATLLPSPWPIMRRACGTVAAGAVLVCLILCDLHSGRFDIRDQTRRPRTALRIVRRVLVGSCVRA